MDVQGLLLNKKIRVTSIRIHILEVLRDASMPIDVSAIADELSERKVEVDTVTIYRNLEIFVQSDIVTQIDFRDGRYRYEMQQEHHHHLICTKCRNSIPIYETCLAITEEQVAEKYGFSMQEHHLEFFGVCAECD